jgi:hypothetical protein
MFKNEESDFLLSVSNQEVICFTSQSESFKSVVLPPYSSGSYLNSIQDAMLKAEVFLKRRLESGILLVDFGILQKVNFKILKNSKSDFSKIKSGLELRLNNFGRKLISVFHIDASEECYLMQALTMQNKGLESVLEYVHSAGVEILEASGVFEFLCKKSSAMFNQERLIFVKFNEFSCEFAKVKNGIIYGYEAVKEYSIAKILEDLSKRFELDEADLITIISYYKTTSKHERLQKYYEREEFDFHLKDLIENTRFICLLHAEINQKMQELMNKITTHFDLKTQVSYCFFYENEFNLLKFHQFLKEEEFFFELKILGYLLENKNTFKLPFVIILQNQVKKFFHLTA